MLSPYAKQGSSGVIQVCSLRPATFISLAREQKRIWHLQSNLTPYLRAADLQGKPPCVVLCWGQALSAAHRN